MRFRFSFAEILLFSFFDIKDGNKQTIPFRRQRLDIDCMLPSSSASSQDSNRLTPRPLDDPYVIDMIKLADERIAHLQSDFDMSKQTVELMETKLSNYKNQVIYF